MNWFILAVKTLLSFSSSCFSLSIMNWIFSGELAESLLSLMSGAARVSVFTCILFLSSSYGDICAVISFAETAVSPCRSRIAISLRVISSKSFTFNASALMRISRMFSIFSETTDATQCWTKSILNESDSMYAIAAIVEKIMNMYFNGFIRLLFFLCVCGCCRILSFAKIKQTSEVISSLLDYFAASAIFFCASL